MPNLRRDLPSHPHGPSSKTRSTHRALYNDREEMATEHAHKCKNKVTAESLVIVI